MAQNLQPKTWVSSLTDISNNNPAIQSWVNSNLWANVETWKTQVPPKPKTWFWRTLPWLTSPIIESETVTPLTTWAKPTPFGRFLPWTRPSDVKSQNINPETPIWDAYIQSAKDQNFVSTQIQKAQQLPQTMEGNMQAQNQISELKNTLEMQKVQAESQANEANQYVAWVADKNQMEANLKFKQQARDTELQQNLMTLNKNSNDFINKANSQISSMIQAGGGWSSKDLALLSQANSYYMQGVQSLENLHKSNSMQASLIQAEYDNYANWQLNKFLTDHSLTTIKTLGYISQLKASWQLYSAKGIQEAKQALLMNNIALSNSVARYSDSLKTATENLKYKADIEYRNASLAENRRQFDVSQSTQRAQLKQNQDQYETTLRQNKLDRLLSEGYIDDSEYMSGTGMSFLNNPVTWFGWAYDGFKWLDIDGKKGDPITGIQWTVSEILTGDKNYGNSIVIDYNGDKIRLSHLDKVNVNMWDTINPTQVIGTIGNTGNVIPWKWGDGSHLDIRVKQAWADKEMNSSEVKQYLQKINWEIKSSFQPEAQAQSDNVNKPTYTETQLDAINAFKNDADSRKKLNQAFPDMSMDERKKIVDDYKAIVNSPEVNSYVQNALDYIPSNQKDNWQLANEFAKKAQKLYLQWYSPTRAKLAMIGINLDENGAQKVETFEPYITKLTNNVDKPKLMKSFSKLLASWNEKEAFQTIENEWLASAKLKQWASFASSANVVNNVDRVIELMNKVDKDGKSIMEKLWPIEWQVEIFTNKWVPWKKLDEDVIQYATELNSLFMKLRHDISGAAVTQSESEANAANLENSVTAFTKNPKAIEITLRELKRNTIDQTNAVRQWVWLPLVDETLLKNYNKSPVYIYIK